MTFQGRNFSFPLGKRTYVMGILNITPDSFFDGGKWNTPEAACRHAMDMERDGADLIDIGAQSTRPGHTPLCEDDEMRILADFLPPIAACTHVPLSVDTFFPRAAEYALQNGASIVNDVSGIFQERMAAVVRAYNAGWIVMHNGGGDADRVCTYAHGVTEDVAAFFDDMEERAVRFGINADRICYDIGIGFGKSHADNMELLRHIAKFKRPNRALLTALSCKRVIAHETGADGDDRKYGTIAANTLAIAGGTDFIRVHHVREAVLAAKMADALVRGEDNG